MGSLMYQVVRCILSREKSLTMKHLAANNQRFNFKWPKQEWNLISVNTKSRGGVAPGSIWPFDCVIKDPGL